MRLALHERVRQQMRQVLASSDVPAWLDATAQSLLRDARRQYQALQLDELQYIAEGPSLYLFLWQGDLVQDALAVLLRHQGLATSNEGVCLKVGGTGVDAVFAGLSMISTRPCPQPPEVLARRELQELEKWDWVLPDELILAAYASRALTLQAAHSLCGALLLAPPIKAEHSCSSPYAESA